MAVSFRIEISAPRTAGSAAKTWTFSPDSGNVQGIAVELKRDKQRLSTATVRIHDPAWPRQPRESIFNQLPDPAFFDVPIKIYLAPPGNLRVPTTPVFDGKLMSLQPSFPGPSSLTIVGNDKSIDARKKSTYKTYRNLTSVQLAQKIADSYGYTIEQSLGSITPKVRAVDIGMAPSISGAGLSDWDHLTRALDADGLELVVHGSTLKIRQHATSTYRTTIRPGMATILSVRPQITHVGTGGGNVSKPVTLQTAGTSTALTGVEAGEASLYQSTQRTHREPLQCSADESVTSAEGRDGSAWSNRANLTRKRKDTCALQMTSTPDITLDHVLVFDGWGGKVDGEWSIESISHAVIGEAGTSTFSLIRGASTGGLKQGGLVPFATA